MKIRVASTSSYFLIVLFAVCLFFSGCIPEEIELPVRIKSVVTHGVSNVGSCGAELFGNVSLYDSENIACGFIYDTSSNLSYKGGAKRSTIANGNYALSISGLKANTIYYYRAYGVDAGQYKYGEILSFKTESSPTVTSGDAIDLGLSVKWASCNVGADSPEEYGDYFAWGETTTKSSYTTNSVTYGLSIEELKSRGIIGADGNLTSAYDAATANWGDNWRMPTLDEMKELVNECEWEWTSVNGVNGRLVTGPNGNSIFLPAAGFREYTWLYYAGSYGYYFSATPSSNSSRAYGLCFSSDGNYFNSDYYCGYSRPDIGNAVRPVSEE